MGTAPVFEYTVSPSTVAYSDRLAPSWVDLQICVYNPQPQSVACSEIVFVLPVGDGSSGLVATDALPEILPSGTGGTPWSINSNGDGSFTAIPFAKVTGLGAYQSIAFELQQVKVNDRSGIALMTVSEGTAEPSAETLIAITKTPHGLSITRFSASPIQIDPPEAGTFVLWSLGPTNGVPKVTLSYGGQNIPVDAHERGRGVGLEATTTFTLTAADADGRRWISEHVTVTVPVLNLAGSAPGKSR